LGTVVLENLSSLLKWKQMFILVKIIITSVLGYDKLENNQLSIP
jgi:hypothetical protein